MTTIKKGNFEIRVSDKIIDAQKDEEMKSFWTDWFQKDWEAITFKIFDRFTSPEFGYIDIGAWIGPTVLYGAQTAKKCYCFEPDRLAFKYLVANVEENANLKDKVHCFDFGVADENCKKTFYVGAGATSMSSLRPIWKKSESYDINVCDFATTVEKAGIDFKNINFIKIDIEGGEYKLIPSLLEYLKKANHFPTLYISMHAPFLFPSGFRKNFFMKLLTLIPRQIIARFKNRKILNMLRACYKNIYLGNGTPINSVSQLRDARAFTEILATNLIW